MHSIYRYTQNYFRIQTIWRRYSYICMYSINQITLISQFQRQVIHFERMTYSTRFILLFFWTSNRYLRRNSIFFMPFSFQLPPRHFVSSLPYVIDFNGETTLKGEKRRRRKKQDNRWGSLFVKMKIYFIFILLWSSLPRIIHKVVSGWYCCHRHSSHSSPGWIFILVLVLFVVIAISSDKNI